MGFRHRENEEAFDANLARALRIARVERGMSQVELGKAIGVSFQQVQKYENGHNRVSVSRLVSLCRALGMAPVELLQAAGSNPPHLEYGRVDLATARAVRRLPPEQKQAASREGR